METLQKPDDPACSVLSHRIGIRVVKGPIWALCSRSRDRLFHAHWRPGTATRQVRYHADMRQPKLFMIVAAMIPFVVGASSADAADPPELDGLDVLYPALERLYIDLHQSPELSLREEKTAAKMAAELRSAGFEVTERVGGFGVVGVLRNGDGPTVMLRTDMDALPVKEQTELAYASNVVAVGDSGESVPVMHACGHDVHMAAWVGAANLLARSKDRWRGTLVFVGQPAEEVVQGAAKDGERRAFDAISHA